MIKSIIIMTPRCRSSNLNRRKSSSAVTLRTNENTANMPIEIVAMKKFVINSYIFIPHYNKLS